MPANKCRETRQVKAIFGGKADRLLPPSTQGKIGRDPIDLACATVLVIVIVIVIVNVTIRIVIVVMMHMTSTQFGNS